MNSPPETTDLLAFRAMPDVAAHLRQRLPRIVELWTLAVERYLPDADPLTVKQVRNSIPAVLEKIALALESATPDAFNVLVETSNAHGVVRFQENYNVEEVLIEYRLLRRITCDQLHDASAATLTYPELVAVDMGIDTALHRGVTAFVRSLTTRLQSAGDAESKYLSFLSHDLRNNLSGVTLTLEWLRHRLATTPDFHEEVKDLDSLQQSITQTIDGMERLLQAERLRKQSVTLKLAPINLHRLVADLLAAAARPASAKRLTLESAVPADAGAHSDRELVTLVLQNLLGNAIKYSPAGSIRITAEEDPLGWRLSVSDQGPGIPPAQLATLFDAFTRGDSHAQPGLGLGLNIASHAARLLGSELRVSSTPHQGSTFSFTLPSAPPYLTL